MNIKKGDTIIVTVGKDKGRKGKVERVFPKTHELFIPGINIVKRHMKKRDEKNPGGIIEIVKPIDGAKVALVCPSCGKPARIGYFLPKKSSGKAEMKFQKERICRKCGKRIG